jgi:hypothetical protein
MMLKALMQRQLISPLIVFSVLASTAMSQDDGELERLANKVTQHIATQMTGWQHKRLIQPSKDVIVDFWTHPNRIVKISMMQRKSVEEAHDNLVQFASVERDARELKGLGDEAYSWGYGGSNIVVRRGTYTVYVSTNAEVNRDADAGALSREQKSERRISEMTRLSREFARHAATVIQPAIPASQVRAPSKFAGDSIPEPPQQKNSWTPPQTQLPANLISATTRLFEQGLADPRGMEYREIEIDLGRAWDPRFVVKTTGWILPGETTSQRFAVCWNGLVYPIVSIGNEVDLSTDIYAAIKTDDENRAKRAITVPMPFYRFRNAMPEGYSLSATSLLPIKVCLLLRLGRTDLAERVWATWTIGMDPKINDDSIHLSDPYLMLAVDWTWAIFDRAINAHIRGDDRLSSISALMAVSIGKSIRQEIPIRPALRARPYAQEYINFLQPLALLIQDQERRAKHPRTTPAPRDAATLRQQSTAQLIDYLDEAVAFQMSIPGGIDMEQDPVVAELIWRGKGAVEPLLNALENDTRLTRAVRSSRPWHRDRHFMTVYETALQALRHILMVWNQNPEDWENIEKGPEGRRTVAARLRMLAQR